MEPRCRCKAREGVIFEAKVRNAHNSAFYMMFMSSMNTPMTTVCIYRDSKLRNFADAIRQVISTFMNSPPRTVFSFATVAAFHLISHEYQHIPSQLVVS